MRKRNIRMLLCVLLGLLFCASVLAEGNYTVEEDGSKWYDDGTIVWPDGTVTTQVDHDQGQKYDDDDGDSYTSAEDGAMVVDTGEADPVAGAKKNQDGSIEIESGTGGVDIEDSPTRAPLEGAEWDAALAGVAARNGTDTPTVWRDPATGEISNVQVVYMGIGRSMITLNGEKKLVNTVDLKWETEAPEDRVLAVVTSRYVWMRKKPGTAITNLKFDKIFRDTVVRVISYGKNWTLVDYNGMRGYVSSGALEFFCNDHTEFDPAYVSVKGKIKGKEPVQLRARVNYGILETQANMGTQITVFDVIEGFAEIDVEGKHCMINEKYVTFEKDLAAAE